MEVQISPPVQFVRMTMRSKNTKVRQAVKEKTFLSQRPRPALTVLFLTYMVFCPLTPVSALGLGVLLSFVYLLLFHDVSSSYIHTQRLLNK